MKSLGKRYSALKNNKKKGFTLLELVVVIAIMAVLALVLVPNLTAYIQKADDAKVKANMKSVHTAAELAVQSNVKDIAHEDNAEDLAEEIEKYANLEAGDVEVVATVGTDQDVYYITTSDQKSLTVTFATDRVTYEFDGKAYDEEPVE